MSDFARKVEGLRWLAERFAVTREEAQRGIGPQLTEGLLASGYARATREDVIAVTDAGFRAMRAMEPDDGN